MRLTVLALILALCAFAQQPASEKEKADTKLHTDVLALVDASGYKQMLQSNLKMFMEQFKAEMLKQCPECSTEFGEEWTKRMLTRLKVDDLVNVVAAAFEKHFTDEEILKLTAFHKAKGTPGALPLEAALKDKLTSQMPAIQGEIIGGMTQIETKLSADVGAEIQKEHPEYVKQKPAEKKD